jgi:hypothetical protein
MLFKRLKGDYLRGLEGIWWKGGSPNPLWTPKSFPWNAGLISLQDIFHGMICCALNFCWISSGVSA